MVTLGDFLRIKIKMRMTTNKPTMKKPNKLWSPTSVNWLKDQERQIKIPLREGIVYFVHEWKKILTNKK